MTCNIGKTERILRVIVGLIITSLAFVGPQSKWALLGLVPVLTGLLGWCGLYTLLGLNTCPMKK